MVYLAERQVAALGSDSNSDTAPASSRASPSRYVLAIQAMGVHLLDYLQFEDLLPACEAAGRWSFLCASPAAAARRHRLPANPIAIL